MLLKVLSLLITFEGLRMENLIQDLRYSFSIDRRA